MTTPLLFAKKTKSRGNNWEHFGSMDNAAYAAGVMEKLQRYAEYGYQLGDNLIMTWEDKAHPLTFRTINEMVKMYLI